MGATLQIEETHVADLHTQRRDHFARMGQLPELYLELMVPHCRTFSLMLSGERAGHALVAPEGTLIELSLGTAACNHRDRHFGEMCRALGIRRILCFSFDSMLVSLCATAGADAHPHGILFREMVPGRVRPLSVLRSAVENDIPTLLPIRDNVFDDEEQVYRWVRSGWVFVLEEGNDFIGAGLCSPVWSDSPARDIGVLVHPSKWGLGHGRCILASLAEECLRTGLVPTGGCAHDNLASRAALHGAGFISRHSLIEFRLGIAAGSADSLMRVEVA